MKRITFFIACIFFSPLALLEEPILEDSIFSFKYDITSTERLAINEAMSESFKGLLLRLTGNSLILTKKGVKQGIIDAENYVDEYALITSDTTSQTQVIFSFNEALVKELIERNNLPLWIGQGTQVLFYLPCSNDISLDQGANELFHDLCLDIETELIKQSDLRSIIMIKPASDFLDISSVNIFDSEQLSFSLDKIGARYGLEHWLACFIKNEFGERLDQPFCQSNANNNIKTPYKEAITLLVDNISRDSQLFISSDSKQDIPVTIKNVLNYTSYQDLEKLLSSLLVIDSFNLEGLNGSDVSFIISINSDYKDLEKVLKLNLEPFDQNNMRLGGKMLTFLYRPIERVSP